MPEYLTKEEIRQWRSSLEKITLEEYAARLGKMIQGEKETNDMIDKVMTHSLNTMTSDFEYKAPSEKLQTLTLKSYDNRITSVKPQKEREKAKETVVKETKKTTVQEKEVVAEKTKTVKVEKEIKKVQEEKPVAEVPSVKAETTEINVTFKKPLIPREQMIFDFLVKNKGSIVYAKDMAALLELPRDYVYKYIKNLRQKINEDVLCNAENGGYVLKIQ